MKKTEKTKKQSSSWQTKVATVNYFLKKRGDLFAKILNKGQGFKFSFGSFRKLLSFAVKHPKHSYRLIRLGLSNEYKNPKFRLNLLRDPTVHNFVENNKAALIPYVSDSISKKIAKKTPKVIETYKLTQEIKDILNKEDNLRKLVLIILNNLPKIIKIHDYIEQKQHLLAIKEILELIRDDSGLQKFLHDNKDVLINDKIIAKIPWLKDYGIDKSTLGLIHTIMVDKSRMNGLISSIDQYKDKPSLSKMEKSKIFVDAIRSLGIFTVGSQLAKTAYNLMPSRADIGGTISSMLWRKPTGKPLPADTTDTGKHSGGDHTKTGGDHTTTGDRTKRHK